MACESGNRLDIDIHAVCPKKASISCPSFTLDVLNGYKDWVTARECGKLSVGHYVNNIGPVRLKDNKVTFIFLKPVPVKSLPGLLFQSQSHAEKRILAVFKHKSREEERLSLKSSIIGHADWNKNPNGCGCFKGFVKFADNVAPLKEGVPLTAGPFINAGKLRFIFDRGRGRLFFNDRELTSGLGVYTSVRVSGIWYDSYQALWRVLDKSKDMLAVSGDWPYLPLSQTWRIEKTGNGIFRWEADVCIREKMNLEIQQANIMLSGLYKKWSAGDGFAGNFNNEYTKDYDILPFRYFSGTARGPITALSQVMPQVLFGHNGNDGKLKAIIENTDSLYKSRLLQFYKACGKVLQPARYRFFEGTISVSV
jgi:hypothetical protein